MSVSSDADTSRGAPPQRNDLQRHDLQRDDVQHPRGAPKGGTLLGSTALCLASLAVMLPWPLLGIMLTRSSFDEQTEAFLLFGGITLFPLMVLTIFGSVPEEVLITLFMLVWLAAAVVPNIRLRRHLTSWLAIGVLFGAQSAFSLAQAVMGALLVVGKNI